MHRRWLFTVVIVVAAFVVVTVAVLIGSPLGGVDVWFYHLDLVPKSSPANAPLYWYVFIGDGVPASTIAALYAINRSARTRSWTPWIKFMIALFLLNAGVGAMKHLTGRLGPSATDVVHTVWVGGTIFPSGHAANAVVMFGLIAMIAPAARRQWPTRIAVLLSLTIGFGTVALRTHWVSDVLGGWLAGGLVLLALRPLTPPVERLLTSMAGRIVPVSVRVVTGFADRLATAADAVRLAAVATQPPLAAPADLQPRAGAVHPVVRPGRTTPHAVRVARHDRTGGAPGRILSAPPVESDSTAGLPDDHPAGRTRRLPENASMSHR